MADWTPEDDGSELVRRGKAVIGREVRRARLRLRVSQATLATFTGISQPVISRLETGRLNGIRWQTLARIIGVLDRAGGFRLRDP